MKLTDFEVHSEKQFFKRIDWDNDIRTYYNINKQKWIFQRDGSTDMPLSSQNLKADDWEEIITESGYVLKKFNIHYLPKKGDVAKITYMGTNDPLFHRRHEYMKQTCVIDTMTRIRGSTTLFEGVALFPSETGKLEPIYLRRVQLKEAREAEVPLSVSINRKLKIIKKIDLKSINKNIERQIEKDEYQKNMAEKLRKLEDMPKVGTKIDPTKIYEKEVHLAPKKPKVEYETTYPTLDDRVVTTGTGPDVPIFYDDTFYADGITIGDMAINDNTVTFDPVQIDDTFGIPTRILGEDGKN